MKIENAKMQSILMGSNRRTGCWRRKNVFNGFLGSFHPHLLNLYLFMMVIVVSSASENRTTTVGFLPTPTGDRLEEPPKQDAVTPPHIFDNPTPSPSKFTLNGQFVTSDSSPTLLLVRSSDKVIPSSTAIAAATFYDFRTREPKTSSPHPSEKTPDMTLLRKLQTWSSSRSSAKLNFTEQHSALLRIETKSNMTTTWRTMSTTATTPQPMSDSQPLTSKLTTTSSPKHFPLLYPEWLTSSGVYPESEAGGDNGTVDYFAGPGSDYESPNSGFSDPGEAQEENPNRQELESIFRKRIRMKNSGIAEDDPERENPADRLNSATAAAGTRVPMADTLFPQVHVVDSGLADVISRGRIDSVKYVYFGDKFNDYHKDEIAGRIIQAVGGVMAAIAQVLTVLGSAKCIRKGGSYTTPPVQLHIGFALLISNLLFLLAVHATEPADVCASVAVILHYLHLVIGCWLLGHTVQTYRTLQRQFDCDPNEPDVASTTDLLAPFGQQPVAQPTTLPYCAITWAAPIPFIITSYLVSPDGYETRSYCWMSLEKGMLISFILPVFLLIGLNTSLVVLSLRHLLALQKSYHLEKEMQVFLDGKTISGGIRASAMLLPLLAIMWFLGVVALENPTSIFFQLTAAGANIALSWLVMYFLGDEIIPFWCPFKMSNPHFSSSDCNGALTSIQPSAATQLTFDNEPLLPSSSSAGAAAAASAEPGPSSSSSVPGPSTSFKSWKLKNKPNWSRPGDEIYELRHDAISTICR